MIAPPLPSVCARGHAERYGNGRCKPCSRATRARYRKTPHGRTSNERYENSAHRQLRMASHRLQYRIRGKLARVSELEGLLNAGS